MTRRTIRNVVQLAGGGPIDERGLALITTLLVMVLAASIMAAAINTAISAIRSANAHYLNARTFYAAEAGVEAALSQLEVALRDGLLDDADIAAIRPPTLSGFDFSGFRVSRDGDAVIEPISDGPWAGLYSLTQNVTVVSQATEPSGALGEVILGAKAQAIPIFQFAVFFDGAMEDYAGSRKEILGPVHANGDLFLGAHDLHFFETVTTAGKVHRDSRVQPHPNPSGIGIFLLDSSGEEQRLTFDSDDTPDAEQFKLKSTNDLDARLQSEAFGVTRLELPLPTGVPLHELIRLREGFDSEAEKAAKLAWKADMYVTVDLGDPKPSAAVCGGSPPAGMADVIPNITVIRDQGGVIPADVNLCRIFFWQWEAFYDYAEERWVDALNVDISFLGTWMLADSANNLTEIIYVNIVPPGGGLVVGVDEKADGYFPILRIINGAQLPGPLTLGGEYPVFVQGDYNSSADWKPSAVFGDRLTVLSNNWTDPSGSNTNPRKPPARDTDQYFAAIIGTGEGYVGCYYRNPEPGCTPLPNENAGPAGWVKLLENWAASCAGRCKHTFVGSFVSLWAPQIASQLGNFPGNNYYNRPERDYRFDARFQSPENLPPGTPVVGKVFRASFREGY